MNKFQNKIMLPLVLLIGTLYTSCKGNDVSTATNNKTVLVQLFNDSTRVQLEYQFVDYALKEQKKVSRPMNIYLFAFDNAKVSDTALVRLLRASNLVKEAQINKEVITREK